MAVLDTIIEIMDRRAAGVIGKIGIGFKNFKTGEEYYVNGDERFPAASAFKVPVLIELFDQAAKGKLSLDDMHVFTREDLSPGSGVLANLTPGLSMCLKDYAMLMMTVSDNSATDIIHRKLGKENITACIARMGLKNTRSDLTCKELLFQPVGMSLDMDIEEALRLFEEQNFVKDYKWISDMSVPNDISSPRDMMTMFSLLYNGEIVNAEACKQMLDIMEKIDSTKRLTRYLPRRGPEAVRAMHKTGTIEYIACDCGIIVTPHQTYGLTIMYNGFTGDRDDKRAAYDNDDIIADISRDIYNALHEVKV